jgi:hypothetical protein
MMRHLLILLLILTLLLVACGTSTAPNVESTPTPFDSAAATATMAVPLTETALTPQPTMPGLSPEDAALTATASAVSAGANTDNVVTMATRTPTPESPVATSTPEPSGETPTPHTGTPAEGTAREIAFFDSQVLNADPSPDGRFWVVTVLRETMPGGPNLVTLHLLDSEAGTDQMLTEEGNDLQHLHAWLPDGQLLWVDQGELFIGSSDGKTRQSLEAPEPVVEVWVGAENIALVGGESALWRLDLATGEWDEVREIVAQGSPVTFGGNLSIAPNGTFAAFIFGGELWNVPLELGEPAERLATIEYPGRGGRINPPYPLADSPYWAVGEVAAGFGESQPYGGVLLDSRDGSLISVSRLYPGAADSFMPPYVSPDGRWLAIPQGAPDSEAGTSFYVASSDDIYNGQEISGVAILGWSSEPAALYLQQGSAIVRVALPSGESATLLEGLEPQPWPTFAAAGNLAFASHDFQVYAFSPDGTPIAVLDIPISSANFLGTHEGKALFSLSSSDGLENVVTLWDALGE